MIRICGDLKKHLKEEPQFSNEIDSTEYCEETAWHEKIQHDNLVELETETALETAA